MQLEHNVNVFFIAGHETSAAALSFAVHMCEQHPEMQERLVQEIQEHIGDDPITYENIKKVPSCATKHHLMPLADKGI